MFECEVEIERGDKEEGGRATSQSGHAIFRVCVCFRATPAFWFSICFGISQAQGKQIVCSLLFDWSSLGVATQYKCMPLAHSVESRQLICSLLLSVWPAGSTLVGFDGLLLLVFFGVQMIRLMMVISPHLTRSLLKICSILISNDEQVGPSSRLVVSRIELN